MTGSSDCFEAVLAARKPAGFLYNIASKIIKKSFKWSGTIVVMLVWIRRSRLLEVNFVKHLSKFFLSGLFS